MEETRKATGMSEIRVRVSGPARKRLGDEDAEKLEAMVRELCEKMGFRGAYVGRAWLGLYVEFYGVGRT